MRETAATELLHQQPRLPTKYLSHGCDHIRRKCSGDGSGTEEIKVPTRMPTVTTERTTPTTTMEPTTARSITEMSNDIEITTIAPLQAVMEDHAHDHSATVRDMPNELTVNSGARRAAARRNTALPAATLLPLAALVVALAAR